MRKTSRPFHVLAGLMFMITAASAARLAAQTAPVPLINQPLVPSSVAPGGAGFPLTVNGTGFTPQSVVEWNGTALFTLVDSDEQLTATVPPSFIASPGTAAITVVSPGATPSNAIPFPVATSESAVKFGHNDLTPSATIAGLIAGDFNGDGITDLAVGTGTGIDILLGNGDGTFRPPINTPTSYVSTFATGDFNGDGKLDLIAQGPPTVSNSQVQIFLGNGDGTFTPGAVFSPPKYVDDIFVGDFNGDGKLDFGLDASYYDVSLLIYLGNGDGSFQSPNVTFPSYDEVTVGGVAVGDFDKNGKLDLAIAAGLNNGDYAVEILLGNGDGTFQSPATYTANVGGANSVTAADFNGDGNLDLVFSGGFDSDSTQVAVLLGNGNGTFKNPAYYTTGSNPTSLEVGDFNNDGKLDLAVLDFGPSGGVGSVSILLGNGDGTFQMHTDFTEESGPFALSLGDFNNDGRLDLAVANGFSGTNTIALLIQNSVSLAPGSLTYGQQDVGTTSPAQTVTLANYGSTALTITSITFTGANPGDYGQTNTCGKSLNSGATCNINITFTPTTMGTRTATLSVNDNASSGPQTVSLTGTAIAPTVTIFPGNLTFGLTLIGTLSPPQGTMLSNTGTGILNITSITASSGFTQQNNCGSELYPGNACTITVQFDPNQTGTTTGSVTIADNAPGGPQTVSLSGTGAAAEVSLIGAYFGNQADGTTSSPVVVTLTNKGGSALTIHSISLSGANTGDFGESNTCGSSVAAGKSCRITLTFTPTAPGVRTATILVTDSDPSSPQSVALSGYGLIAGPSVALSSDSLPFAQQAVNSTSPAQIVTLTNNGSATVNITSIAASENFSQTNTCGASVSSGANCTISVTFTPAAAGALNGTVTISDNAGTGSQNITLAGTAQGLIRIPGNVAQIQVGSNGSVFVINSSQQVFSFNAETQNWVELPGLLTQLSVGADGSLWGINATHQVYCYDSTAGNWDLIPGQALLQVSVGYKDAVWGLNSSGQIVRYDTGTEGWDLMPGVLAQITVGPDGAVWGANSSNSVFHFNARTQNWDLIGGAQLTQVAVGYGGVVWGVNTQTRQIYLFSTANQSFELIPGTFTQVAVGADGSVWAIDGGQSQAYRYDPGLSANYPWDVFPTPTPLAQISVGYAGAVWAADTSGNVYQFQPTTPPAAKTLQQVTGALAQVAVAADGNVWGLDSAGSIYAFNSATQNWDWVPGQLAQIAVGFGGAVWGINSNQQIFRFNSQTQDWTLIPGLLTSIAVGSQNAVWGINSSGQVYQYSDQQWYLKAGLTATQIAVSTDGTVSGLNTQQQIYRYNNRTQNWQQVAGLLQQIAVGSATAMWGVNSAQQIFSYATGTQKWNLIPGLLNQVAVGVDGVAWGFNNSGEVFEYNSNTQQWNLITGSTLSQIAVGADEVVWGINSGQTYRAH